MPCRPEKLSIRVCLFVLMSSYILWSRADWLLLFIKASYHVTSSSLKTVFIKKTIGGARLGQREESAGRRPYHGNFRNFHQTQQLYVFQILINSVSKIQVKLYLKRMEREGIARVGIFVHNDKWYPVLAAIHWTFLLMF